jgi:NADH-quinone oxidoreductase subunit C
MVSKKNKQLHQLLDQYLTSFELEKSFDFDQTTLKINKGDLINICTILKETNELSFSMLIDLCGVDYLDYGLDNWKTLNASRTGFSRAVEDNKFIPDPDETFLPTRFAVIYHLLSIAHNWRIRLRIYTGIENPPSVKSVSSIWASANWFEREAFDLFGIHFDGHPDLRRILTDYEFIGHPFRKDFPTSGNLEVYYDEEEEKVKYRPVSITTRPSVPRVIRKEKQNK